MALVAAGIYVLLVRFRSRWAAFAFALYLVVGCWGTAEGRFDLIPSTLTLIAVIFGVRKRWNWAFAFLALATLFKFYPLVLLVPFLLAQQMESGEKWSSWRRLLPLGSFVAVCGVVMGVSLFLSVEGTLAPFGYFQNRPIQVESSSATILWLLSFLGFPLRHQFTYGSLNVLSPFSSQVALLGTALLGFGLLYTYWLQWSGKVDVALSSLFTLFIVMFTGKVFSPQYLIWVAPLVAYIWECNPKVLIPWSIISLLTTFIYPYIYNMGHQVLNVPNVPLFYPVTAIRNGLFFGFILFLLIHYSRKQSTKIAITGTSPQKKLDMSAV
jgi:hypothetical protein